MAMGLQGWGPGGGMAVGAQWEGGRAGVEPLPEPVGSGLGGAAAHTC